MVIIQASDDFWINDDFFFHNEIWNEGSKILSIKINIAHVSSEVRNSTHSVYSVHSVVNYFQFY